MPARRLTTSGATVRPYDVLARSNGSSDLMVHALLCYEPEPVEEVTINTVLKMFHMGPPLGPKRETADAVGSAHLSVDQTRQIKTFIDERQGERDSLKRQARLQQQNWDPAAQYVIHPPFTRPDMAFAQWRFSCVGLALLAYRDAGLNLLAGPFPLKTVDDLKQLYPFHAPALDNPEIRLRLGIGNGDRWPVALVGYLLHALARPDHEVNGPAASPYTPVAGDEFFPSQAPAGGTGGSP